MQREPLKDRAVGQWPGILSAIGLPTKALSNRHGPCPMCGGKDRFRFDNKGGRGTWICSQCGAGDGIELVKRFAKCEFKEAAQLIEPLIGTVSATAKGAQQKTDGQKRDELVALWKRSRTISLDDHAGQYLNARTGMTSFPACLRYSPDERYADQGKRPSYHPALIAKVDPCDEAVERGETAALHRTYLSPVGTKADVPTPRKMLGSMPTGAAVRLMPYDDILGIAEGIETALSASIIHNVPCWAALTAGLLEEWKPPEGLRALFIYGDNDASNTGQAAAYALAKRMKVKGLDVFVEFPPRPGQDWNDVLMRKLEAA